MKKCPQCQRIYDDKLSFCLQDGTALMTIIADETETETQVTAKPFPDKTQQMSYPNVNETPTILPSQTPNANAIPSKNPVNYFLLAALLLTLGIIGGGGLALYLSGFSTNKAVANANSSADKPIGKTPEIKIEETPEIKTEETVEDVDNENSEEDSDEPIETPTPEPKVCYLSDGGSGGGEVNIRRNCDTADCTTNANTIAGTYSNKTPLTKLGKTVRSGGYTWVKIRIDGGIYWVAASKIRCE